MRGIILTVVATILLSGCSRQVKVVDTRTEMLGVDVNQVDVDIHNQVEPDDYLGDELNKWHEDHKTTKGATNADRQNNK